MKKLIELDAAIKATWKDTGYTDPLNVMTAIRDRIEALPSADAIPVVRCNDCKWYQSVADKWCGYFECMGFEPDDYCSQGERKDGDRNG